MTPYDELALAEAVAEGAEFMDAIDANVTDDAERWFWVVEPERLAMHSNGGSWGCITAQHHPDGIVNFSAYEAIYDCGSQLRVAFNVHGFPGEQTPRTDALTALWREEIINRRAAWFDAHPEAVLA